VSNQQVAPGTNAAVRAGWNDAAWGRPRREVRTVQVRGCLSFRQVIDLDLEYIDKWSLWLDLVIFVRTPGAVVRAQGAA